MSNLVIDLTDDSPLPTTTDAWCEACGKKEDKPYQSSRRTDGGYWCNDCKALTILGDTCPPSTQIDVPPPFYPEINCDFCNLGCYKVHYWPKGYACDVCNEQLKSDAPSVLEKVRIEHANNIYRVQEELDNKVRIQMQTGGKEGPLVPPSVEKMEEEKVYTQDAEMGFIDSSLQAWGVVVPTQTDAQVEAPAYLADGYESKYDGFCDCCNPCTPELDDEFWRFCKNCIQVVHRNTNKVWVNFGGFRDSVAGVHHYEHNLADEARYFKDKYTPLKSKKPLPKRKAPEVICYTDNPDSVCEPDTKKAKKRYSPCRGCGDTHLSSKCIGPDGLAVCQLCFKVSIGDCTPMEYQIYCERYRRQVAYGIKIIEAGAQLMGKNDPPAIIDDIPDDNTELDPLDFENFV